MPSGTSSPCGKKRWPNTVFTPKISHPLNARSYYPRSAAKWDMPPHRCAAHIGVRLEPVLADPYKLSLTGRSPARIQQIYSFRFVFSRNESPRDMLRSSSVSRLRSPVIKDRHAVLAKHTVSGARLERAAAWFEVSRQPVHILHAVHCVHTLHKILEFISTQSIVYTEYHRLSTRIAPGLHHEGRPRLPLYIYWNLF